MNLPECRTWKCGRYTVRSAMRLDSPLWLQYIIMRGGRVLGYSFSCPDASQCEDIERFGVLGRYAESSPIKRYDYRLKKRKA